MVTQHFKTNKHEMLTAQLLTVSNKNSDFSKELHKACGKYSSKH